MYYIKSYTEANSIKEAIELLKSNPNGMVIAGGTDILIKAREFKKGYTDKDLIGITRISQLSEIKFDNEFITIGACSTFSSIEKNEIIQKYIPALATAVGMVGGPQIRNVGTIGGNICNGATSADSASILFNYEAIMVIEGASGKREVEISKFYISAGKVDLKDDEILTSIKIKKECFDGYKGHYIKFAQRKAMDIATIGCAVILKTKDNKTIEDLKIAYGVAGPTPLRAVSAEEFAKGKNLDDKTIDEICNLTIKDTKARDSWRASKDFREQLIKALCKKAIKTILGDKNA